MGRVFCVITPMTWINIGKFLERFKELKPPKKFIRDETAKIINSLFNVSINPKDINYRGGIICIKKINPALKNEIFIKKEKILQELSKKLGKKTPKEISF